MARIQHIAIFSDNPRKLAEFYRDTFGMTIEGEDKVGGQCWVSDGYMNVALLPRRLETSPRGIHHFGFTLEESEKAPVYAKMEKLGLKPYDPRQPGETFERPLIEDAAHDIDGNKFDLTTKRLNTNIREDTMRFTGPLPVKA
jgi:catechol 2,3-dioxygenase-like lactoylglutathione lyase family enzyme